MKDVAAAAKVSQAAVSYAFSGSPKVSAQQRAHIMATAADLGYRGPQIAGSSLRRGRIGTVGVIVADSLTLALEDPSTTMLMKGIVEVSELADVALTLLSTSSDAQRSNNSGHSAALRGLVDGVVLHNISVTEPVVADLIAHEIPTVAIDSPHIEGIPLVTIDHRAAGRSQIQHVLDLGHRRVGVVTDRIGPGRHEEFLTSADVADATEWYLRQRLQGYFDGADALAEPCDLTIVEADSIGRTSGKVAVRQLLTTGVTAILATSDVHAAAALSVLAEEGIDVPAGMSVVGFDDAPLAEMLNLSTVRQPLVDKGKAAASMLLERIEGRRSQPITVERTRVIARASSSSVSRK